MSVTPYTWVRLWEKRVIAQGAEAAAQFGTEQREHCLAGAGVQGKGPAASVGRPALERGRHIHPQ